MGKNHEFQRVKPIEDTIMSDDNAHLIRKGPIAAQIIFDMAQSIHHAMPELDVWLFGSYAWGRPGANSDVDIFVVHPDEWKGRETAVKASIQAGHPSIPRDVIACSKTRYEHLRHERGTLMERVETEGVRL